VAKNTNEKTAADIKLLRAQTKELQSQIAILKNKKKLVAGISDKEEDTLRAYQERMKLMQSELKASKTRAGNSTDWATAQKKVSKIYNDLTKESRKLLDTQHNFADLSKTIVTTAGIETEEAKLQNSLASDYLALANASLQAEEQIGTERFSAVDTAEMLNRLADDKHRVERDFWGDQADAGKVLLAEIEAYKEQTLFVKKQGEYQELINSHTNEYNNKVKEVSDKWNSIKAKMDVIVANPMRAMFVGAIAIGGALIALGKTMTDFANETGLSYSQVARLGPGIALAGDEAKALLGEFGTLDTITNETLVGMKALSFQYGISAESTAKLMSQMMAVSGLTAEAAQSTIGMVAELAKAEGVSPAAVLEDMAENTEFFASFAKDGGKNLGVAAVQARKLGLSLGTTAKIADTLLDFEGSIEKQMEASVLLGRNINLDRARGLAFSGDMVGLQKEVLSLVGSQAEFEQMNVIQRRALADSIGVGVDELSKMIMNQQKISEMTATDIKMQKSKEDVLGLVTSGYETMLGALQLLFIPLAWVIENTIKFGTTIAWIAGIITAVFLPAIISATVTGMIGFKNAILGTIKSRGAYITQMWSKIFVTQADGTASKISIF